MKFLYLDVSCSTTKALPPLSAGKGFMATPSAAAAGGADGADGSVGSDGDAQTNGAD